MKEENQNIVKQNSLSLKGTGKSLSTEIVGEFKKERFSLAAIRYNLWCWQSFWKFVVGLIPLTLVLLLLVAVVSFISAEVCLCVLLVTSPISQPFPSQTSIDFHFFPRRKFVGALICTLSLHRTPPPHSNLLSFRNGYYVSKSIESFCPAINVCIWLLATRCHIKM